jgi:osmotically-inducible protein OsmY
MGYEPYRNDNRNDWGVSDRSSSRSSGYGYGYEPDRDRYRSSAREYYAGDQDERSRGEDRYGARGYPGGRDYDDRYTSGSRGYRNQYEEGRSGRGRGRERGPEGYSYDDRGFFDRAGDEVRSWFGDEEAERRRAADARYDARYGNDWGARDDDYHGWRRRQIEDLDRDYHEYRRENQTRFENEFGAWRTERQGQRSALVRVTEHMEVVGSDGAHIGTVDKVRGDRIVLTKSDPDAGGHHHSIPSRWIESVDDKVTIRKTADEAKAAWRDEDRSGALFGERDRDDNRGPHYLNRSFSGTY